MKTLEQRQNDLRSLLNEFRTMEQNRKDHAEESQSYLKKQQVRIDKIRKDNELLKTEISTMVRANTNTLTVTQQEILKQVHESGDRYANLIANERETISDLEYEIQQSQKQLIDQRKAMGGVNASRDNNAMIQKQIKILEHRLEKSIVKFNESIAQNKSLRLTIDELRKEQMVYENIYAKMERELFEKKQKMAELIESSNSAYEQRDAYLLEIAVIEQAQRKEKGDYDRDMSEMNYMLENELKLPVCNRTATAATMNNTSGSTSMPLLKGFSSATRNSANNNTRRSMSTRDLNSGGGGGNNGTLLALENGNNNDTTNHSSSINDLSALKKSMNGMTMNSNNTNQSSSPSQQQQQPMMINHIQNFEEAFDRIRLATGINDVNDLVKTFIKNEQNNYSLFKYVTEQTNEIEKIQEKIHVLEIEEQSCIQTSGDVNLHKQLVIELEKKRESNQSLMEKYEIKNEDLQTALSNSIEIIQTIYNMLYLPPPSQQQRPSTTNNNSSYNTKPSTAATDNDDDDEGRKRRAATSTPATVRRASITTAIIPYDAATAAADHIINVNESNFANHLGQIEEKVFEYMEKYNAYKQQAILSAAAAAANKSTKNNNDGDILLLKQDSTSALLGFPDDDIPDYLRSPPRSAQSSKSNRIGTASSTTTGRGRGDDNDNTKMSILSRLHTPSSLTHPSDLNMDDEQQRGVVYGSAGSVNDDRPMSRSEITTSAIHTIRTHRTTPSSTSPKNHNNSSNNNAQHPVRRSITNAGTSSLNKTTGSSTVTANVAASSNTRSVTAAPNKNKQK